MAGVASLTDLDLVGFEDLGAEGTIGALPPKPYAFWSVPNAVK